MGLHEEWCLYLAALVCWAYGFPAQGQGKLSQQQQQQLYRDPADREMDAYLVKLDVGNWKEIERLRGMGGTEGLLEGVRGMMRRKGNGILVNEGERVVGKLAEGRSRLSWF